jgi:hypothetical protein
MKRETVAMETPARLATSRMPTCRAASGDPPRAAGGKGRSISVNARLAPLMLVICKRLHLQCRNFGAL